MGSNHYHHSDGHDDCGDHAEETENFGEDENQNESHKDLLIDSIELDTLLAHKSNSIAGGDIAETSQGTRAKEEEWCGGGLISSSDDLLGEEDGDDESVDGENTSHNDGDD